MLFFLVQLTAYARSVRLDRDQNDLRQKRAYIDDSMEAEEDSEPFTVRDLSSVGVGLLKEARDSSIGRLLKRSFKGMVSDMKKLIPADVHERANDTNKTAKGAFESIFENFDDITNGFASDFKANADKMMEKIRSLDLNSQTCTSSLVAASLRSFLSKRRGPTRKRQKKYPRRRNIRPL